MYGSARRGSQGTLSDNAITHSLLARDTAITRATHPSHARDSKSAIKATKAVYGSARRGSQGTLSDNAITHRLLARDTAITRTRQQVSNQSDKSNVRQRTAW